MGRDEVGGKFFSLWQLARRGLPVPPAFCVPPAVSAALGTGDVERADGHARQGPGAARAVGAVEAAAARVLLRYEGPGLLVVRSSAVAEDGAVSSRAGFYHSALRVSPGRLVAEAARCSRPPGVEPIPVIVQAMIAARAAGVLFSQHPGLPVAGAVLVEAAAGEGERLLAGDEAAAASCLYLPDGGWRSEHRGNLLSSTDLDALLRLAWSVEAVQGCGRDIEWAIDGQGRLWILQSRPITTLPGGMVAFGGERVDGRRTPAGGGAPVKGRNRADRRALAGPYCIPGTGADVVKIAAREVALELRREMAGERAAGPYEVRPQRMWVFRCPPGTRPRGAELSLMFDAAYAQMGPDVVGVRELPRKLATPLKRGERAAASGAATDPLARRVKDYPVAQVAGVSSSLAGGGILIEYAAGAGLGIARGLVPASAMLVAPDGRLSAERRLPQAERYVFDRRLRRFASHPYGRRPWLDPRAVPAIVRLTRAVTARVPHARVEWWIVGRRIYLVDFVAESTALAAPSPAARSAGVTWVSAGHIRGRLVWVEDLNAARSLCERLGMEAAMAARGEEVLQLLGLRVPQGEPAVIGAAIPAVALFALSPYAAGFVFSSGSVLCHLGTLLREARVPAVVAPRVATRARDGTWVDIEGC
jgi:hypothetical protein